MVLLDMRIDIILYHNKTSTFQVRYTVNYRVGGGGGGGGYFFQSKSDVIIK